MTPAYAPALPAAAPPSHCGRNIPPLPLEHGRPSRDASPAWSRLDRALNCTHSARFQGLHRDQPVVAAVAVAAAVVLGTAAGFAAGRYRAGHN
jgi:hypothetical protein